MKGTILSLLKITFWKNLFKVDSGSYLFLLRSAGPKPGTTNVFLLNSVVNLPTRSFWHPKRFQIKKNYTTTTQHQQRLHQALTLTLQWRLYRLTSTSVQGHHKYFKVLLTVHRHLTSFNLPMWPLLHKCSSEGGLWQSHSACERDLDWSNRKI
jgi:hypothetical protein